MELSKMERITLINQLEMMKGSEQRIYGDDYIDRFIDILVNGYQNHYDEIFNFLSEPMDIGRSEFILELFQMYDGIWKVINNNPQEFTDDDKHMANFSGFDGNESGGCYGYASFLGKHYNFYDLYEAKGISEVDRRFGSFNSHGSEDLDRYESMHEKYKEIVEQKGHWYLLTVTDVKDIIKRA